MPACATVDTTVRHQRSVGTNDKLPNDRGGKESESLQRAANR